MLVDERGAAGDGEARFGFAADDLQRKARLALDPGNEVAAVFGDAAGLGGNEARTCYPSAGHFGRANLQGIDGARHRFLGQDAGAADAFAELDDARKGVDDEEAPPRSPGHEQPAIVGAEVQRAVNRTRGVKARDGPLRSGGGPGCRGRCHGRGNEGRERKGRAGASSGLSPAVCPSGGAKSGALPSIAAIPVSPLLTAAPPYQFPPRGSPRPERKE